MLKHLKWLLISLWFIACFLFSFDAFASNILTKWVQQDFVAGEILVKFKKSVINIESKNSLKKINTFATTNGFQVMSKMTQENMLLMKIQGSKNMESKIQELELDPSVEYAEPNYLYYTQSNDPYYSSMWSLPAISWPASVPMINTLKNTNSWVVVAVVDVGVDYLHPDLEPNMRDGTNCVSETGAKLWGCIHGYDFMDNDLDPLPWNSAHGTNVAGILWAVMDNNEWYVGVNPYVKIMALRAWNRTNLPASSIIRAINFATTNGAKVINASFGNAFFSSWTYDAIQAFRDKGWLFVVAAGNRAKNHDTYHYYPCDYDLDNIICVWSIASNDALSSFSDMSSTYIDTVAPWSAIYNSIIDIWPDATSEPFTTTAIGDIPSDWTRSSWYNDRWVMYRSDMWSNVLATNMTAPYADNTTTYVQRWYDLSSADGVELKFDVGCDTEFITDWWADYLTVSVSRDWEHFETLDQIDEGAIDSSKGGSWTAIIKWLIYNITWYYFTSWFTTRFTWTTNGVDNNHDWCFIDNLGVTQYYRWDHDYWWYNGTSQATPHVAWVASLLRDINPNLSYQAVKNIIIYSWEALDSLSGKTVGGNKLSVYNSLLAAYTAPRLSAVHLGAQNKTWSYIKSGDIVFLSFTGNRNLSGVSATINHISATITWSENHRKANVPVNVLSEWPINFELNYFDELWYTGQTQTTTTDTSNLIVDLTNPDIVISTQSYVTTWDTVEISGTAGDANGISEVFINDIIASWTNNWYQHISLIPWINNITVTGVDLAGNSDTKTLEITRIPSTNTVSSSIIDQKTVNISFTSNFAASGFVEYWTGTDRYIANDTNATWHNIFLTNLQPNTQYTYRVYSMYQWIAGQISSDYSFQTPDYFDINSGVSKTVTWSAFLFWSTQTSAVFHTSWLLNIVTQDTNNSIQIGSDWLVISVSSGIWDQKMYGLVQTWFIWIVPNLVNYIHVPSLTFTFNSNVLLWFTGPVGKSFLFPKIFVGTWYADKILKIYTSADNNSYAYSTDCKVDNGWCTFATTWFSSFTVMSPNTIVSIGGGSLGGWVSNDRDKCESKACIITPNTAKDPDFSDEFNKAYQFAVSKWITTKIGIKNADLDMNLTRSQLAKIITNYAINVLWKSPNTSRICTFSDISTQSKEMQTYSFSACQLGLMGQDKTTFDPNWNVTRAQFSTILSRLLYGKKNEWWIPYYAKHLAVLQKSGIIKNVDPNLEELRGYVLVMLMRVQD